MSPSMLARRSFQGIFVLGILLLFVSTLLADGPRTTGPWNLEELYKTPTAEWGVESEGIREVYYAGEPAGGKPTRVFAFYGQPSGPGPFPAMVLVHGGGGKAFRDWVQHWVKRGYAAIAMDLSGNGPAGRLPDGGPDQSDDVKFRDFTSETAREMWTYHAVSAAIRGHSLLAAQPAVDKNRIGVTGISWGGYLTCIVSGLDQRFKVAVPVYGCGYLDQNSVWIPRFEKMSSEQRQRWVQTFDPAVYLPGVSCPILFINGTNDFAYPMDSYQKCYNLVKPELVTISMIPRLPHGHIWTFPEVDAFIDQTLNSGRKLLKIGAMKIEQGVVSSVVSSTQTLSKVELHYTTDQSKWQDRTWVTAPAELKGDQVVATLPGTGYLVYYLGVTDDRGVFVSSPHQIRE